VLPALGEEVDSGSVLLLMLSARCPGFNSIDLVAALRCALQRRRGAGARRHVCMNG
jgi:hypothetical protein